MSEHHLLKTLLNIHLASDASAALHLPHILDIISPEYLTPSVHLSKWTARIQGLLHSKEPRGRWAGLVLAQRTATLSQPLLIENGHTWIGIALPLISKNDPTVVLKAAIRLLRTIFIRLHGLSEFRRHVAVPNIPKLLAALIPLVEHMDDMELKVVSLKTLAILVPLYPGLLKPSYPAISGLALRFLDGHPSAALPFELLSAASRLYSASHVTGGKVGASSLWRKTFDETLAFGTNAFQSLRTTFGAQPPIHVAIPPNEDPVALIPQQLDRLKCAITVLDDLLGTTVFRPVQLPLGVTVQFALQLMRITSNLKGDGFVDPTTYTLEFSVIPGIQVLGCSLMVSLAQRINPHLLPYLNQIMTVLIIQLERQKATKELRSNLLHTIEVLLRHYPSFSPLIATRLMKAVLPSVSRLLACSGSASNTRDNGFVKARKGKRRAQAYEGDELFSSVRSILCPAVIDGKVLLLALEVIRFLLRDPHLSTTMQTITVRVLLATQLAIVRIPPATLSPDPTLYLGVLDKLRHISTEFASGTSSTLSKCLPLTIAALTRAGSSDAKYQRQLDLLLHPRLPPLMRSMPLAENISLIFSEEPDGEAELRKSLGLFTRQEIVQKNVDVELVESNTNSPAASFAQHSRTLPTTSIIAPNSVLFPVQPVPVLPLPSPGNPPTRKEKLMPDSKPSADQSQKLPEEHLPVPFHSPVIEAHKIRPSKVTSEISQARSSTLTSGPPVYNAPTITVEDEDEEMPGIDLDSDSE